MAKQYKFTINGNPYAVDIQSLEGGTVEVEVNGTPYTVQLDQALRVPRTPKLVRAKTPKEAVVKPMTSSRGFSQITAPLPGNILV